MASIYDFEALNISGKTVALKDFEGKALLIVNTASKCGFTPQFAGLEELHKAYADKGLVVLGFPCNQFGSQDPGSNGEIAEFCSLNYGARPAGQQGHQMELHQVPGRQGRQGPEALRAAGRAQVARQRH